MSLATGTVPPAGTVMVWINGRIFSEMTFHYLIKPSSAWSAITLRCALPYGILIEVSCSHSLLTSGAACSVTADGTVGLNYPFTTSPERYSKRYSYTYHTGTNGDPSSCRLQPWLLLKWWKWWMELLAPFHTIKPRLARPSICRYDMK